MNNDFNEEKQIDVSNLIALCSRVEPLSAINKIIINQNVSRAFEFLLHAYIRTDNKPSRRFGAYICLLKANPRYYGNYIDKLLDYVSEDDINEMLMYIRSGIVHYQIWIDKVKADLKNTEYYRKESLPSMLTVYLLKTLRCSLIGFKKLVKALREEHLDSELQAVLDYAELKYMELPSELTNGYASLFSTEIEEKRRQFQDNELTLFSEILWDQLKCPLNMGLVGSVESIKPDKMEKYFLPIWDDPNEMMRMFSGMIPGGASGGSAPTQNMPTPINEMDKQGMGIFAVDLLGYDYGSIDDFEIEELESAEKEAEEKAEEIETTNSSDKVWVGDKTQHTISNKNVEYVVCKVAKHGSSRVVSETPFGTKEEAEKFKKEVESTSPEMLANFDFKIETRVRG